MLALGLLCLTAAFCTVGYLVLAPTWVRVAPDRRGVATRGSGLTQVSDSLASWVDRALRRKSWSPVTALQLEMAGIETSVGAFVVTVVAADLAATLLVASFTGSIGLALLVAIGAPLIGKIVLSVRASKRRAAFAEQLDSTLQLLASALRAGHSLPRSLDTTARESMSPTAEEFGRLVNENRIGRDLVEALHTTADRMDNEDFHWIAEAVAMQRETGGNLNEVLDRVGNTIRERNALRREVHTLSAEGRMSAIILMVLPTAVGLLQVVMNPGNIEPMIGTSTGRLMLGVCCLLYVVGGLWMRAVIKVKI